MGYKKSLRYKLHSFKCSSLKELTDNSKWSLNRYSSLKELPDIIKSSNENIAYLNIFFENIYY